MRRGDIFWVDLELVCGSESNKKRPCLIVSRNEANDYASQSGRGTVTVLPITS
ncbi:MAG: type II toxin-antitoxin system PemK/MazF family toxin, partial [Rothia sp. (in: high G+C Gram-positive bacteria)]|nr:type II toxin-antitoxin system PemK/MazF family toxin [Rothia sp. (in: high G+C Gram-positive bacteria)]